MSEAAAALTVAIVGAATGVASLAWNVIAWRRQGPTLKVRAKAVGRGPQMVITGSIGNSGRMDATITGIRLGWTTATAGGAGAGRRVVINLTPDGHLDGMGIPYPLSAQGGTEFTITDIEAVDPGLYSALHDGRDAGIRFITATGASARARIRYR